MQSVRLLWVAVTAGSLGCNAVLGIEQLDGSAGRGALLPDGTTMDAPVGDAHVGDAPHLHDARLDAADAGRHDAEAGAPAVDAGCGTIVVVVGSDFALFPETQAVFAVASGEPDTLIAANDAGYGAERKKTWRMLSPSLTPATGTKVDAAVSACIGAGAYALEYWDITPSDNNGVPPSNKAPWQVGLSSSTIHVDVGTTTTLGLAPTESNNVPTAGSFAGMEWASWAYGDCPEGGACPGTTQCYEGVCYDMGYDVRNCGEGGKGCMGTTCCDGKCIDTATDEMNCGSCGNPCGSGGVCTAGECK
jgi:hypothetical protein